jgi:hypothetical protein
MYVFQTLGLVLIAISVNLHKQQRGFKAIKIGS